MKISKVFFLLNVFVGVIILMLGLYLYFFDADNSGFANNTIGSKIRGAISARSAILIGIIVLLQSIRTYRMYKDDKDKSDKTQ